MFPETYKKFYFFLVLSIILSLGLLTFFDTESTTGLIVNSQTSGLTQTTSSQPPTIIFKWPFFFIGVLCGAIFFGTILFIFYYEKNK